MIPGRCNCSTVSGGVLLLSGRRQEMDQSKRHAVQFLEKEIKTYKALALFLSKEEVKKHVRVRDRESLTRLTYYKDRMREAKKLIRELRKSA
jgi:hypothetical protein